MLAKQYMLDVVWIMLWNVLVNLSKHLDAIYDIATVKPVYNDHLYNKMYCDLFSNVF